MTQPKPVKKTKAFFPLLEHLTPFEIDGAVWIRSRRRADVTYLDAQHTPGNGNALHQTRTIIRTRFTNYCTTYKSLRCDRYSTQCINEVVVPRRMATANCPRRWPSLGPPPPHPLPFLPPPLANDILSHRRRFVSREGVLTHTPTASAAPASCSRPTHHNATALGGKSSWAAHDRHFYTLVAKVVSTL